MGNKTCKFTVPPEEKTNKAGDEVAAVAIENGGENHQEIVANGDHSKEVMANGEANNKSESKKKNLSNFLKKFSMRKEKKSKTPKENGVKDVPPEVKVENCDEPAAITDKINEENHIQENHEVANGHVESGEETHERISENEVNNLTECNGHDNDDEKKEID